MKLLLLLAAVTSGLVGAAETRSVQKGHPSPALRLLTETKLGVDSERRAYTSETWYVKNAGPTRVWLPLPKERLLPKSMTASAFLFRARGSGGWTSPWLAEHEVNYEADWVALAPGGRHQLFAVTFYEEGERFKEVEVSLTYRDSRGKVRKVRLSWLAA